MANQVIRYQPAGTSATEFTFILDTVANIGTLWTALTPSAPTLNGVTVQYAERYNTNFNVEVINGANVIHVAGAPDAFFGVQPAAPTLSTIPVPLITSLGTGVIAIPASSPGEALISYNGGAGAYTLGAPTAGSDDGKSLRIISSTAQAHVITGGVDGFNAKGSSGTLTFAAAKGNACTLLAYGGHWYVTSKNGVTVA